MPVVGSSSSSSSSPATTAMQMHRCRFVEPMPSAVTALAFTPPPAHTHTQTAAAATSAKTTKNPTPLLACARANGNIEIWNPVNWHLERTIPGIPGSSIESVVWVPGTVPSLDEGNASEDSDDENHDQSNTTKTAYKSSKASSSPSASTPPNRLLSAGLDGFITEWDLITLSPIARVESGGGAIWCMDVSPCGKEIAVGCEDGCVRAFTVGRGVGGNVEYKCAYNRQDGRILSLAYHPNGKTIAVGSSDSCIRVYSTETTRCLTRSTVDTLPREDTLVWSVRYLPSGTHLVSGDSLGAASIWDAKTMTMKQRFKTHGADILCLGVSPFTSDVFYSSGIDSKIVRYRIVDVGVGKTQTQSSQSQAQKRGKGRWVVAGEKRYHSHDVRALAVWDLKPVDVVVSGGVDTGLSVSSRMGEFPVSSHLDRLGSFPQRPLVSVAKEARFVLGMFDDLVKVWALGVALPQSEMVDTLKEGLRLDLMKSERLIADIKLKCMTNLVASSISGNGNLIAVSDLYSTRLFSLYHDKSTGATQVSRIKSFPSPAIIPGSVAISFTPDSRRLILSGTDSVVRVINVSSPNFSEDSILAEFTAHLGDEANDEVNQQVNGDKDDDVVMSDDEDKVYRASLKSGMGKETVLTLAVSPDGQWLASGDLFNRIFVYNLDSLKLHTALPKFSTMHTCFAFTPSSPTLAIATKNNELYMYNVEERKLTDWSREYSHRLPYHFLERREKIMGMDMSTTAPHKLVVWSSRYVCTIDLSKPLGPRDAKLYKRIKSADRKRSFTESLSVETDEINGLTEAEISSSGEEAEGDVNNNMEAEDDDMVDPIPAKIGKSKSKKKDMILQHEHQHQEDCESSSFYMALQYGPLLYFGFAGGDEREIVAVERPVISVMQGLPPSFFRKKYGQ